MRQVFATAEKAFQNEQGKKALPKARVMLTPGGAGIQVLREEYESQLRLLMSIAGLVLLIACANIAGICCWCEGMGRRAEMSVRTALGAMRGRIVRQLLTESVLLAGMGGLAGLAVAYAGNTFSADAGLSGRGKCPDWLLAHRLP